MKKSLILTQLFVLLFCSVVLAQATSSEIRIGASAGPTLGSEDFKELYSLAILIGVDFAFFASPQLALGGNLHYGRFGIDEDAALGGISGSVDGGAITGFEILGMGRYYFKPPDATGSKFYILGGLGVAAYKTSNITVETANSTSETEFERQSDFMLSFGVGSKFEGSSSMNFFVEVTLSIVFSDPDKTTYLPLRAGVAF